MKILDCKGLACPKPVILTKKEFEKGELQELEVIVDNEAASINVSKFANSIGAEAAVHGSNGLYHIEIKKMSSDGAISTEGSANETECRILDLGAKELTILVSSDVLGTGDDKLGAALMKSYFYALTESDVKPTTLLFLNGGVKLTCEGSDVLESIRTLEKLGTEVLSCGTCLDFYGLKEKLLIGSITNMYTIIEKMHGATNTIKL